MVNFVVPTLNNNIMNYNVKIDDEVDLNKLILLLLLAYNPAYNINQKIKIIVE